MKTRKLLTFALSLALLFIAIGASAQTHQYYQDMVSGAADSIVNGATMPYYVEPDPVLNDISGTLYDTTQTPSANGVNTTFSWSTTVNNGGGSVTAGDPDGGTAPYQYYSFTGFTAPADVTISVQENHPEGCSGSAVTQNVIILDQPTFAVDDGNRDFSLCDGTAQDVILHNIPAQGIDAPGYSNFKFQVDVQKITYQADETTIINTEWTHSDSTFTIESFQNVTDVVLRSGYYFNCGQDGTDDVITKYHFDFGSFVDAGTDGINHHISRKSDYYDLTENGSTGTDLSRAAVDDNAWTYYPPSGGTEDADMITVTVYPEPSTGDIYFVPNDFDLQNN